MDNRRAWMMEGVYVSIAIVALLFVLFLVKLIWAWTVPDLFPGAVATGLVAKRIGWITALKLAVFLGILAGVAGVRRNARRGF